MAGWLLAQAWDVNTLQCLKTLEGHEDNVRVLAVGRGYLFSGSWDKTVRVWAANTLECVKVRFGGCGLGQWRGRSSRVRRAVWLVEAGRQGGAG